MTRISLSPRHACARLLLPLALFATAIAAAPESMAQSATRPGIVAIAPAADGYIVFGSGFGTDKGRIAVIEGSTTVPAAAILQQSDTFIKVRSPNVRLSDVVFTSVIHGGPMSTSQSGLHIRVSVGGVASNYAVVQPPAPQPGITAVAPTADGYIIFGSGFGTDKSRITITEGNATVPAAAILQQSDTFIKVRSPNARPADVAFTSVIHGGPMSTTQSGLQIRVSVAGTASNLATLQPPAPQPPGITAVAPTADGYVIFGSGFGTDKSRVAVAEGNAVVPAAAIVQQSDGFIKVRSARLRPSDVVFAGVIHGGPTATTSAPGAAIRVSVAGIVSNMVAVQSPTFAVTAIAPTGHGYVVTGSGFGSNKSGVTVVENGKVVPPNAILSFSDTRIEVRSAAPRPLVVAVRNGNRISAPLLLPMTAQR